MRNKSKANDNSNSERLHTYNYHGIKTTIKEKAATCSIMASLRAMYTSNPISTTKAPSTSQ